MDIGIVDLSFIYMYVKINLYQNLKKIFMIQYDNVFYSLIKYICKLFNMYFNICVKIDIKVYEYL